MKFTVEQSKAFTEEEVKALWSDTDDGELDWEHLERGVQKDILTTVNTAVKRALEVAKGEPIEFKDILAGDTIRREWMTGKVKWTAEGKVLEVYPNRPKLKIDGDVAWHYDDNHTYYLVDRPAPPLPTEQPALIKVTKFDGASGEWLARLTSDGRWNIFDLAGDDDEFWKEPHRIEEWTHFEIREVER